MRPQVVLLLLLLVGIASAKPRMINADFVGGCGTLQECTRYDLVGSSNLEAYPVKALHDRRLDTCWVTVGGPGSWFEVVPKGRFEVFYCGGFTMANGHCKSVSDYQANSRVRAGRVEVAGQAVSHFELRDVFEDQSITFKPPVPVKFGQRLRLVIESVYPGQTYEDCCISEFEYLNGRH